MKIITPSIKPSIAITYGHHSSSCMLSTSCLNLLKNYIAQHGSIVIEKLYDAPFTSVSHEGIDGVFTPDDVGELIAVLKPFIKAEPRASGSQPENTQE